MDHAENGIVDHDLDDRNVIPACSGKFIHVHAEASVTRNIDNRFARPCGLYAQRRTQPVSHGSQAARSEQLSGFFVAEILSRPHLVLADLSDDPCIPVCQAIDLFHDKRTGETVLIIVQRKLLCCFQTLGKPRRGLFLLQKQIEPLEDFVAVADHTDIHLDILIDLCRIYIDMDNLRSFRKLLCVPDHAVGESASYCHKQITAGYTQVRRFGPVHPEHAQIPFVTSVETALAHERIAHRSLDRIHHLLQFFGAA